MPKRHARPGRLGLGGYGRSYGPDRVPRRAASWPAGGGWRPRRGEGPDQGFKKRAVRGSAGDFISIRTRCRCRGTVGPNTDGAGGRQWPAVAVAPRFAALRAFTPPWLASALADDPVRRWRLADGKPRPDPPGYRQGARSNERHKP